MAHAPYRSMNAELIEGSVDGRVKKIRPDSCNSGPDGELLAKTRQNLSLPYYGVLEPREILPPGKVSPVQRPYFIPNKGTATEATGILGQTW